MNCTHGIPEGIECGYCTRDRAIAALRTQVAELAEVLEVAKDAMDERRCYVNAGEPSTCWQEMKYGKIWDAEDARVEAALAKVRPTP